VISKKKKGDAAKYSMGFMKRVARMPVNDGRQILKILRKHKHKQKAISVSKNSKAAATPSSDSSKNSNSSVNKDWENWVVLHGKSEKVAEDVKEIDKVAGLIYDCETKNCFNLLTKEGRKEWRSVGVGNEGNGIVRGKWSEAEGC